jgi:hypothetical protein
MTALLTRFSFLRVVLAVVLFLQAAPVVLAQEEEPLSVTNVRFELSGVIVRVEYDLGGAADRVYRISLYIRRENDPMFQYRPVNVAGDIGQVVFPGEKKKVTWEITKEFPVGLEGDDYYFVVQAEKTPEESSDTLWWVGGGAAVVGGVVAIILLSKGSGGSTPPAASQFPYPPGRP